MKCPKCGCADDKVIDTRAAEDGKMIRRRRECLVCGTRFTTIERMEEMQLNVIKKDGTRQEFQRDKILKGLVAACSKRPVTNDDLLSIVNDVEASLQSKHSLETTSDQIGEMIGYHHRHSDMSTQQSDAYIGIIRYENNGLWGFRYIDSGDVLVQAQYLQVTDPLLWDHQHYAWGQTESGWEVVLIP